jgi:hypothetical protein
MSGAIPLLPLLPAWRVTGRLLPSNTADIRVYKLKNSLRTVQTTFMYAQRSAAPGWTREISFLFFPQLLEVALTM